MKCASQKKNFENPHGVRIQVVEQPPNIHRNIRAKNPSQNNDAHITCKQRTQNTIYSDCYTKDRFVSSYLFIYIHISFHSFIYSLFFSSRFFLSIFCHFERFFSLFVQHVFCNGMNTCIWCCSGSCKRAIGCRHMLNAAGCCCF